MLIEIYSKNSKRPKEKYINISEYPSHKDTVIYKVQIIYDYNNDKNNFVYKTITKNQFDQLSKIIYGADKSKQAKMTKVLENTPKTVSIDELIKILKSV